MGSYKTVEVEQQIKNHETAAGAFRELAETDFYRMDINADSVDTLYHLSVPVKEENAKVIARRFFYDMALYHFKQQKRWELILSGADPVITISDIKK